MALPDISAIEGAAVGGIIPLLPDDVSVASEKNVVNSPLLFVVDAGTNVGPPPTPPPPFVITCVEVPEMIVVTAPLTIVVIRTVVIVTGSAGNVTIVRVRAVVHSHEVE